MVGTEEVEVMAADMVEELVGLMEEMKEVGREAEDKEAEMVVMVMGAALEAELVSGSLPRLIQNLLHLKLHHHQTHFHQNHCQMGHLQESLTQTQFQSRLHQCHHQK